MKQLEVLIGQKVVKIELTESRTLQLETATHGASFSELESEYDQGGAWLDIRRIDPSSFLGATILGFKHSEADEEKPTKDLPPDYVTESGPYCWELYIIETDRGNIDLWFLCTDGGHCYGSGDVQVYLKN